jgi:putative ABC transport system ATP-binding protein/lipoprotein-releasing system ATP-binding protein
MTSPVVETIDAARIFTRDGRAFEALRPTTCRVRLGERIAIVGPSGSGKSTLLHLMSGIDRPTSGKVAWPDLGPAEIIRPGAVAIVPQMPSLVSWLSVLENVALPELLRLHPQDANKRAMFALDLLGLGSLAERLPQELSGGQAQRVALARALVGGRKLILADEPTGQLDGLTASTLFDVLLTFLASRETALVVATHDEAIASRMGKIWSMIHGQLNTSHTHRASPKAAGS